jgi:hypothetical protein
LNEINNEFNSSLELNEMDVVALNSSNISNNWQSFYLDNGYINVKQLDLINEFSQDASDLGFDTAIQNFESSVLSLNLSDREFGEYNLLANSLYLMNDYYNESNSKSGMYAKGRPSWWGAAGCGVAIASNAISTYALIACAVPNPTTPAACGVAVVAKALSFAGIIFGCS